MSTWIATHTLLYLTFVCVCMWACIRACMCVCMCVAYALVSCHTHNLTSGVCATGKANKNKQL